MQITMTEPKPWLREMTVEVEADRVKQKTEETVNLLLERAEVPGFRKGRIPRELVERRFAREIEGQVAQDLIEEASKEALEQHAVKAIKTPELSEYELTPDKTLKFKLSFEVLPEFELKDYLGIPVKAPEPTGFDAEFERRLEHLRDRLASYTPVSRPSQAGDYLMADYAVTDDAGAQLDKRTNVMFHIGDHTNFPELNEQLAGLNPGDEKDIVVHIPADYDDKKFAGRTMNYHLGIRSIKVKELPEVDEDFAANLGYDSLDHMRVTLNQEIMADRDREAEAEELNQIYRHLVENHNFDPPPSLVQEIYEDLLLTYKLEDGPEVKERLEKAARTKARFQIVIANIARKEEIEVSDEERDKVVDEAVASGQYDSEALARMRTSEGLRYRLLEDKVMKFLLSKAQVTGAPASAIDGAAVAPKES